MTYVSSLVTASSNRAFYIVYISLPLCQYTKNASKWGLGEYRKRRQGRAAYLTYVSGLDAFSNGA